MRKSLLSILVVICMIFTLAPLNAFAADWVEFDVEFEAEDGSTVIYHFLGREDFAAISLSSENNFTESVHLIIPETVEKDNNTYNIVEILDEGFKNCNYLQSVEIPNTVEVIGCGAFEGCENLESVIIGNRLFEIRDRAFYGCNNLEYVLMRNKVAPTILPSDFTNVFPPMCTIYYPHDGDRYEVMSGWEQIASQLKPDKEPTPDVEVIALDDETVSFVGMTPETLFCFKDYGVSPVESDWNRWGATPWVDDMQPFPVTAGTQIHLKMPGDGISADSDVRIITVTQAEAPDDITVVHSETPDGNGLVYMTDMHEYKAWLESENEWAASWEDAGVEGSISLPQGKYLVRVKANGAMLASEPVEIIVACVPEVVSTSPNDGDNDAEFNSPAIEITFGVPMDKYCGKIIINNNGSTLIHTDFQNSWTSKQNLVERFFGFPSGVSFTVTLREFKSEDGVLMPDYEFSFATREGNIEKAETENGSFIVIKADDETETEITSSGAFEVLKVIATPDRGYRLSAAIIQTLSYPSNFDAYPYNTFPMPNDDIRINVTFEEISYYSVNIAPVENGDVSFRVNDAEEDGAFVDETVIVTVSPSEGYELKSITVVDSEDNNIDIQENDDNVYSFVMPDREVTVSVEFDRLPFTLTIEGLGSGEAVTETHYAGDVILIDAGTKAGHTFDKWTSDNGGVFDDENSSETTFTMPENNVTITATWTADEPAPNPDPTPTPNPPSGGGDGYTPTPKPTPTPTEDTFVYTPSLINEMIDGQQRINIDNGLQIIADLNAIPRDDEDSIIIKVSEIKDADKLNEFYDAYPTQKALLKGYEVNFTVENSSSSTNIDTLNDTITIVFQLTPEDASRINPAKLVVYKEDENGAVTKLTGVFNPITLTFTVETDHLCNFYIMAEEISSESWVNPFTDVSENDWFYDAVEFVNRIGLYEGTQADKFTPNGTMTRAMFWTVLGRANGQTLTGSEALSNARTWAMSFGITDGTNPDNSITREQMVTTLWRYLGSPKVEVSLENYLDTDKISDYAKEAIAWAVKEGIIVGWDNMLMPQDTATRAQAATIFKNLMER